jgi:hypothetical protein
VILDLSDCAFSGSAFPEPFVRFELAERLAGLGLLRQRGIERDWAEFHRRLRSAGGGQQRVCNHVLAPLAKTLGYGEPVRQQEVATREGTEDGGWLLHAASGTDLRAWAFAAGTDLDVPHRNRRAYRFSPMRSASRVLAANSESLGLLTDGQELRLLLRDPVRSDSHIAISLTGSDGWRARALAPDSFRFVLALASPKGIAALSELLEAARLSQTRVTQELRVQARAAIEGFLQAVIDGNAGLHNQAAALWHEGLIIVYRLLFILKLESTSEPSRGFSFASSSVWRLALSPNRALGTIVRRQLDLGHDTGHLLENGLRLLFRIFRDGLSCSELSVAPLGGALFASNTTPLLDQLVWGERAVALLLDRLLWTTPKGRARERVHYGSLNVEDLGRVYETLLELEPGITTTSMSRLRRSKLEVVVPIEQAAPYFGAVSGRGTRIVRVEDIPPDRFFLRAGLGRKASGSYYTPHDFVCFLVRETLAPKIANRSPDSDPQPGAILNLKVIDPAVGSGHFLVEACRYLGEALYLACRTCDDLATAAQDQATSATPDQAAALLARASELRQRIASLPDPDGLLLAHMPSRASEGGISQARALAICRRLVAVHCLYGVDSNRLAIELAKLSIWLESYAEGLPLTFLDHRLVHGDSLSGGFCSSLSTLPISGKPAVTSLTNCINNSIATALREVRALEASIGSDVADIALKTSAKQRLDQAVCPLRLLAQAWSGAVMLAVRDADTEWDGLARAISENYIWPKHLTALQASMLDAGHVALPWDLAFPEVFSRDENGFDAVISNPPWDIMQPNTAGFLTAFDLSVLDTSDARSAQKRLLDDPVIAGAWHAHRDCFARQQRIVDRLYSRQRMGALGAIMSGKLDSYRVFAERMFHLVGREGAIGMLVPSAFHANEGATGVRELYLQETRLETCFSFENREKLFDIDGRFKYDIILADRPGPTHRTRCAFYLTNLTQITDPDRLIEYDQEFIAASGGKHSTFLELRHRDDLAIAQRMFVRHRRFGAWSKSLCISLSRELHMTDDARSFTLLTTLLPAQEDDYLPLHEGKTIHQFTDRWDTPRYYVARSRLANKPATIESSRYYRAACREVAGATNERTVIAAMLPPGVLCGHTLSVERTPGQRPNSAALVQVAMMNSFCFDWLLRQKAAAHVSIYILADLPVPNLSADAERFLAHVCLHLCCNHSGFATLWTEQLGARPPRQWPAISAAGERWRLRAAMDAIIALAYGLDRPQYARILGSFNHKSFPAARDLCLGAFDELSFIGQCAFVRKNDPHYEVALVTNNAAPILDRLETRSR